MNKERAKAEFIKIVKERNEKAEIIRKEAKKKGIWEKGVDSNRALFKALDDETKQKIEDLKSMIDD